MMLRPGEFAVRDVPAAVPADDASLAAMGPDGLDHIVHQAGGVCTGLLGGMVVRLELGLDTARPEGKRWRWGVVWMGGAEEAHAVGDAMMLAAGAAKRERMARASGARSF